MIARFIAGALSGALITGAAIAEPVAVTGGRVVTNAGGDANILENATVVFDDGVILAVGSDGSVPIPADATVVDATGRWVTPGLFAPYSQVGLVEISLEDSANDASADESPFNVALDTLDGFNPSSAFIPVTRVEGITRMAIAPDPGGAMFAGLGALVDTSGTSGSAFDAQTFVHVAFGNSGASLAGGSRSASWAYFKAALDDARGYPARFMAHKHGDAIDRYDAAALGPYARGQKPILVSINREADIRRLLALLEEEPQLDVIILGGAESHLVADELAAADVPVILDPTANLPRSFDSIGASSRTAVALKNAGVTFAFSTQTSGYSHEVRLLPQHAGVAVAHGLDWADAFAAITLGPAQIYGVDDTLGRLAPGYTADLVIWDGDPLEVMAAPDAVYIGGVETDMETRQTKLRDRYLGVAENTGPPVAYRRP